MINLLGGGYCKGDMDINLVQCYECGYVYNENFDNEKMSKAYFNGEYITPKSISNTMSANIKFLKDKIEKYTHEETIFLEIAPGACDLLLALALKAKMIYSVDPSLAPSVLLKDVKNVLHIRDLFNYETIFNKIKHKIDFILFRHLIEHIGEPRKFLEDAVLLLEENGMIYVETPNALNIFDSKRFFEIRHEHCAYYQKNVLINIMSELGCSLVEVLDLYNGQNIGLFFRKNNATKQKETIEFFDENLGKGFNEELKKLEDCLKNYEKIVLYGAAGHANSLISYLSTEICKKIVCAIDKDKRRQRSYLQNSSILILEPSIENLKSTDCIVMAMPLYEKVVYEKEIKNFLEQGKIKSDIIFTSDRIQIQKANV